MHGGVVGMGKANGDVEEGILDVNNRGIHPLPPRKALVRATKAGYAMLAE